MRRLRTATTALIAAVLAASLGLVGLTLLLLVSAQRRAGAAEDFLAVSAVAGNLAEAVAAGRPVRLVSEELSRDTQEVLTSSVLDEQETQALQSAVDRLVAAARTADQVEVDRALDDVQQVLSGAAERQAEEARRDRNDAIGGGALVIALVAVASAMIQRRLDRLARTVSDQVRFEAVVAGLADVLLISDMSGRIAYASPASGPVLGVAPQDWPGRYVADLVTPPDRVVVADLARRAVAQLGTAHGGRVLVHHAQGRQLHIELLVHRLTADLLPGEREGLVWTLRDVTGAHVMEQRLRRLAFYDPLTGLPNRFLLVDRLEQARGQLLIMIVDVDHFRDVLDVLGRAAGDQLLAETARRICACGPIGQTVARVGSNAFAVVREDGPDPHRAAQELLAVVTEPLTVGGFEHNVGFSIGVVVSDGVRDAETLLRDAHTALHAAKVRGGRTVLLFEPSMHARAAERLELAAGLASARRRGELQLAYQPVVELASGQVSGVEALLRWRHPRLGSLTPDAFVPLAEEGGTITDIGAWALEEACGQAVEWRARLGSHLSVSVSVNLSPLQLRSEAVIRDVDAALTASGLAPSLLILEITEGVLVEDFDLAVQRLAGLKELGVRLAIDDFGTGYSSLSYLPRFPIDILKVDRSFLTAPDEAVLRGICSLSSSLGLRTVAEGIETPDQARLMREVGCDAAQGFLFAPPIPAGEVELLLGAVLDVVPG